MSWNVRGLGSVDKCNGVRNLIRVARCDVVCLQESKLNEFNLAYFSSFLPSYLEKQCVHINAINSSGGCIISWRKNYIPLNSWSTRHTCSVILQQKGSGEIFTVTNVYGPSIDTQKEDFLREIKELSKDIKNPWIMAGDFNLVRWMVDRSGDIRGTNLMDRFNDLILELQLVDVPLKNRKYTWCNKREDPIFSKIDRIFMSAEWSMLFPVITLHAQEMIISDHVPLVLLAKHRRQYKKQQKMELAWINNSEMKKVVLHLWDQTREVSSNQAATNFLQKSDQLKEIMGQWHRENFGKMDVQLKYCKQVIGFFDQIEEKRKLDSREFNLRQKVRQRAYDLSIANEVRWKQRAKCHWLKNGDNNTRFFHAFASARTARNTVISLEQDGISITGEQHIRTAFLDHMKSVLGSRRQVLRFEPKALYQTTKDLSHLQAEFSEYEVERAVRQLAKNKSSGPDGLPNEFLQHYWHELKGEVMCMVNAFYSHDLDLSVINRANIIMIPKKETAITVKDYRPISVINLIPKLLSKILALRLSTDLPDLVSIYQTAFIRGRHIAENFIATREILSHINETKNSAILVKIDFSKAFDSVNWEFILDVMTQRGFPNRWVRWVQDLLDSATSRVVINGEPSEFFAHKQGLRQGDPLSPMLFLIAADVFQQMLHVANTTLTKPISSKISESILALQYADDTALVASADRGTLVTLKLILSLFSKVSGLQINYTKSSFVEFNLQQREIRMVKLILECQQEALPVTYLGMPLTTKKPTKASFMPLVKKFESRLQGWRGKLLSRGGRLQLVNSVLSSLPIYYMNCFRIPRWAIKRMDKVRRLFLWGKNENDGRGISLINWETACMPKELGGLGIRNLEIQNISLLLRWWWRLYQQSESLWRFWASRLRGATNREGGITVWLRSGSFFWVQLLNLKGLFHSSTQWNIGNGNSISFWFDNWQENPLRRYGDGLSRPIHSRLSLAQALPRLSELLSDHSITGLPILSSVSDVLMWKWESSGEYSSKSLYSVLMSDGKDAWDFNKLWSAKCPHSAKIFMFLVLNGRILTQDMLLRRHIVCQMGCIMCSNGRLETALHLLFECRYAVRVWRMLSVKLGINLIKNGATIQEIWTFSTEALRDRIYNRGGLKEKIWISWFICTTWAIWKQRNERVFRGSYLTPEILVSRILNECSLWLNFC